MKDFGIEKEVGKHRCSLRSLEHSPFITIHFILQHPGPQVSQGHLSLASHPDALSSADNVPCLETLPSHVSSATPLV